MFVNPLRVNLKKNVFSSKIINNIKLFFAFHLSVLNLGPYISMASCISIKEFFMLLNLNTWPVFMMVLKVFDGCLGAAGQTEREIPIS